MTIIWDRQSGHWASSASFERLSERPIAVKLDNDQWYRCLDAVVVSRREETWKEVDKGSYRAYLLIDIPAEEGYTKGCAMPGYVHERYVTALDNITQRNG